MRTYTVTLPCKAYIKKYVETLEGNPISFDSGSMLCMVIRAYLENMPKAGLSKSQKEVHLLSRSAQLKLILPVKKMWCVGHYIQADNLVLINRFLEECFEKDLVQFISGAVKESGRYKGYNEAYQAFADLYNIELEQDISLDGLKKMEYRRRQKKIIKNFLTLVPSFQTPQLTRVLAVAMA